MFCSKITFSDKQMLKAWEKFDISRALAGHSGLDAQKNGIFQNFQIN